jgi:hypothetical protein
MVKYPLIIISLDNPHKKRRYTEIIVAIIRWDILKYFPVWRTTLKIPNTKAMNSIIWAGNIFVCI